MLWKLGIVATVQLPWWSILASIAAVDWVLDWVFLLTIGLIAKPIASIFIWILNIVHLPFTIIGWFQRLIYELWAFPIDGWLIFLGNGCFLRFGGQCRFEGKGKIMRLRFDIPWFTGDSLLSDIQQLVVPPEIEDIRDVVKVTRARRSLVTNMIPVWREAGMAFDAFLEHIDF